MSRLIKCEKLGIEAEGLAFLPYPGELGQRIYNSICAEAWQQWQQHQTILINEYRLNMLDEKSRHFLEEEMEKFLFGEGSDKPDAFVAPESDSK